ncbi:hypothetical protein, partial [Clostridium sp. WB02_MRS01]|uniref:hypothetical protein n=1 Tax=Clostridium sp. WB02_MRS01 TaxID=2605777 RepID=UPI001A9BE522
VNHFFIFLQNFLIAHRCVLEEVFAAVFSGELYHTKAFDKCQQLFQTFLFFLKNMIFTTFGISQLDIRNPLRYLLITS